MPFQALNNINIEFNTKNFIQRFYSAAKALSKFKQVEFIDKHKFAKMTLNKNSEILIVHVAGLEGLKLAIYSS